MLAGLPADTRPVPTVAHYDQLLHGQDAAPDADAADEGQDDAAEQRQEEERQERQWWRALKPIPADVAGAEGYRGAVWPDGWGRYHVVAAGGERIGYAERGGGVRARGWVAHAHQGRQVRAGMPTRARAVAELVRRHRDRTPATDAAVDGLPGWRLVQTLRERDRHRYQLIDPGGRPAGAIERHEVAPGRRLWRATGGDPANPAALHWSITPAGGDADAIADEDAWRTRAAAVRALAASHAPALTGNGPDVSVRQQRGGGG